MKIFAVLLCFFGFCCCGNQAFDTGDYPKHVQLARFMEPDATFSKLSSVAEKVEYVALETNDECLIGSTKNIQVTADGY